jgi:hypothetical protein
MIEWQYLSTKIEVISFFSLFKFMKYVGIDNDVRWFDYFYSWV